MGDRLAHHHPRLVHAPQAAQRLAQVVEQVGRLLGQTQLAGQRQRSFAVGGGVLQVEDVETVDVEQVPEDAHLSRAIVQRLGQH